MSVQNIDQKRYGKLKWAVFHGRRDFIKSFLDNNTPVDNPVHLEGDFRPPLHSSVYLGDLDIVAMLLDKGASVNAFDRNNETALMLAAKFERYSIVDLLLSNKRLKNCANRENFTHLHIACMRNRVDIVRKLMENETCINTSVSSKSIRWSGYSLLHFAVHFQSTETVAYLLSIGSDIILRNSNGLTALHLANMIRNDQIIDMILEAHKRVAHNPIDPEGLSHFHIACTRNNTDTVECFIRNGVALGANVHATSLNWPNHTAIDFAILYDCVDVVRLLLMAGGRKIFPTKGERTDRLTNAYCSGNAELIDLLLQRDELEKGTPKTQQKLPSLHYSCIYDDLETIKKSLIGTPSKLNTSIWQGSIPLHLAIERGDEEIIRYLLEQDANYNIKNADGKTPLHLAFERNMKEITDFIVFELDRNDENPVDNNGFSHLHIACIRNDSEGVARLIELGTDVNTPVNFDSPIWPGFTPLHFAAKFGSAEVAKFLLKHGASYFATDKYNLSAFDVAIFEFRAFCQENSYELLDIMRAILSAHEMSKIKSFNDRGFSLLHLLYPGLDSDSDDAEDDYRWDLTKFIKEHPNDLNKAIHKLGTPWDGYTPLHFAMKDDYPTHAKLLVDMGANIHIKAANGNTPLHLSLFHYTIPRIPERTLIFDQRQCNPIGNDGASLFHIACSSGNKEWVEYFLKNGVDPNSRNTVQGLEFLDKAPLHLLTKSEAVEPKIHVVRLLLERGADVSLRDHHLNTPLHYMIGYVESHIIDLLVHYGADVNSRNAFLETPLLTICKNHWVIYPLQIRQLTEKIASFLNHGADINLADERGTTPLSVNTWESAYRLNKLLPAIKILIEHTVKLKVAGLYISEVNEEACSKLWDRFTVEFKSEIADFMDQCKREIKIMTEVRTDIYTTLHDILLKDLNSLSVMSGNDELRRMIYSEDFMKKYPLYGHMVKLQLERGQERKPLLSEAKKNLRLLMNISIPQECLERILQFLTNKDLKNIILSKCQPRSND